ncbi:MAG: hypothetical protein QXL17_03105 [Candidatus Thermoplasmatota archaeon]
MEETIIDTTESSCMFVEGKKTVSADEQLALFMHKFNLDWDTVEVMPAFEQHCKALFCSPKQEKQ